MLEDRKRSSSSDSRSVIVTSLYNVHSHLHQLSVMSIAEGREEQPHWVVRREEVELTEEVVGRGGWGEVRVAMFRGLRVAAKFLYDVILSDSTDGLSLPGYVILTSALYRSHGSYLPTGSWRERSTYRCQDGRTDPHLLIYIVDISSVTLYDVVLLHYTECQIVELLHSMSDGLEFTAIMSDHNSPWYSCIFMDSRSFKPLLPSTLLSEAPSPSSCIHVTTSTGTPRNVKYSSYNDE